jgi:hypothetical protein
MMMMLDVLPQELDGDQRRALTAFCCTVMDAISSSDTAQSRAAVVTHAFRRALLCGSCAEAPRSWLVFMYELRALVDVIEQTTRRRSRDVLTLRRIVDENWDLFDDN